MGGFENLDIFIYTKTRVEYRFIEIIDSGSVFFLFYFFFFKKKIYIRLYFFTCRAYDLVTR